MSAAQLYPYEVSTAVQLTLGDFDDPASNRPVRVRPVKSEVDDDKPVAEGSVEGYDACSSSNGWQKLAFQLTAELSARDVERVLPTSSSLRSDTAMVVSMTCPTTKMRHGVRLGLKENGVWTGHAMIQRQDVKGTIVLRPQLVRLTEISATDASFATKPGAVIAVGEPVTIYVDVAPSGVTRSSVVTIWEDFANSSDVWRREHQDDVFHLEPFSRNPQLFLNSRYSQLREILDSGAKRGPEAVLRDMTAAMIAQPVLIQLATVALTSLEMDEDSESMLTPSGWRGDFIAGILPRLYPEETSSDERSRRAAREIREPDGAASLLSRLGSVVQEFVSSFKTVESAVRVYESMQDREGTGE